MNDDDNVIHLPVGRLTTAERFAELYLSFPALTAAPLPPLIGGSWDVVPFMRWTCSGISHGERVTARFVLGVWNPGTDWVKQARLDGIKHGATLKRFDLLEAMGVWDRKNRDAFIAWCKEPFWP